MVVVAILGKYPKSGEAVETNSIVASNLLKTMNTVYTVKVGQPGKTHIDSVLAHTDGDVVMGDPTDKLIFQIGTTSGGGEIMTLHIIDGTGSGTQTLKGGMLLSIMRDGTPNMAVNPFTANGPTNSAVANWNLSASSYTPEERAIYLTLKTEATRDLDVATMATRFGCLTRFGKLHVM